MSSASGGREVDDQLERRWLNDWQVEALGGCQPDARGADDDREIIRNLDW
jgi:hypothetical protein